jgi:predicted secreted protein
VERKIDAVVGHPFGVVLADLPGSGYLWSCRAIPDGIRLLSAEYLAGPPPEVGSARDKEFRFVADRPGQFTVILELKRRWEAEPIEERVIRIRARACSPPETPDRI